MLILACLASDSLTPSKLLSFAEISRRVSCVQEITVHTFICTCPYNITN